MQPKISVELSIPSSLLDAHQPEQPLNSTGLAHQSSLLLLLWNAG